VNSAIAVIYYRRIRDYAHPYILDGNHYGNINLISKTERHQSNKFVNFQVYPVSRGNNVPDEGTGIFIETIDGARGRYRYRWRSNCLKAVELAGSLRL
jgi:hypothetical protein